MVTYEGLPGPVIGDHLTREASRPLFRLFVIPMIVKGMGTFPVRAFAEIA